jgi:hypothetical protein
MCEYIRAGCSPQAIQLLLDLQENKCINKQLQAYVNDNLKIKDDLNRFKNIDEEFKLQQADSVLEQYLDQFECRQPSKDTIRTHLKGLGLTNLNQLSFSQARTLSNSIRPKCAKGHD